jgi:hypothetical protein
MADKYWVGGTGNIGDVAHWSLTSGGAGGAAIPNGSTDNVYIDNNSFSADGQTITINTALNCLAFDTTGCDMWNATITISNSSSVRGSFLVYSNIFINHISGTLTFNPPGNSLVNIITGGNYLRFVTMSSVGTTFTLFDDFYQYDDTGTTAVVLGHTAGTLNVNGYSMYLSQYQSTGSSIRHLDMPYGSNIHVGKFFTTGTVANNFTLSMHDTSTIYMDSVNKPIATFGGSDQTYTNVSVQYATSVDIPNITGNNVINNLIGAGGNTVTFATGSNNTINNIISNGSAGSTFTVKSASTAAVTATITKPSGTLNFDFCSIKNIVGSGSLTATNSIDLGGNTGITFLVGYAHKVMGQLISKIIGTKATKVNGI